MDRDPRSSRPQDTLDTNLQDARRALPSVQGPQSLRLLMTKNVELERHPMTGAYLAPLPGNSIWETTTPATLSHQNHADHASMIASPPEPDTQQLIDVTSALCPFQSRKEHIEFAPIRHQLQIPQNQEARRVGPVRRRVLLPLQANEPGCNGDNPDRTSQRWNGRIGSGFSEQNHGSTVARVGQLDARTSSTQTSHQEPLLGQGGSVSRQFLPTDHRGPYSQAPYASANSSPSPFINSSSPELSPWLLSRNNGTPAPFHPYNPSRSNSLDDTPVPSLPYKPIRSNSLGDTPASPFSYMSNSNDPFLNPHDPSKSGSFGSLASERSKYCPYAGHNAVHAPTGRRGQGRHAYDVRPNEQDVSSVSMPDDFGPGFSAASQQRVRTSEFESGWHVVPQRTTCVLYYVTVQRSTMVC